MPRVGPGKAVAGVFALTIVCSLVFAGLATVFLDRASGPGPEDGAMTIGGEGGPGEFEQTLRTAIAEDPDDAERMVALANLLATLGESAQAIEWYERALAIDPDNVGFRLDFALSLAEAGHETDAEVQYRRVISLDANNAEAHYSLAELYRAAQPPRTEEAVDHYRQAIAVAPASFPAERAAEQLQRLGEQVATPSGSPEAAALGGRPEATA